MKNHHITHLFTALLLGAVLPFCSCEQQENTLSDGEDVLTINATLDGKLDVNTRSYSGDVSIVDKGFTIAGYLLKGQYAPETMTIAPNVFDKSKGYQAVSKLSATNAKFKIPLPLIGLGTEDEPTYLSVLAWTQGDTDTGYGITGQTGNSSVGMPYLNINLQSPEGKQGDIAAAQKIDHLNDYVITAIDLDFKHILSKMSFVVKNSTGTGINVKDVKLAVAGNALYSKAKYTFNGSDSIGIYSDYSAYYPKKEYTPSGWATTPTLTDAGTATLGELLLIPQKALAGFITVKVTYTVNGDAMNTPITRTLPLKANDLRAGKNYIYTLDVNANAISVVNVTVGGWKEAPTNALPMVPGECGDVVLLLEGKDEPYQHTNGKLYWLDRSGYNNHCEIINGSNTISWNNQDGYLFTGTGSYVKVPDLGQFDGDMLCELVCYLDPSYNSTYPTPISFQYTSSGSTTSTRAMMTHINSSKNIYFDYGKNEGISYQRVNTQIPTQVTVDWDKRAFYAFSRDKSGYMSVMRNKSIYQENQSVPNNNAALFKNGLIGEGWKGEINYVKIVKGKKTVPEVEEDYEKLALNYKIQDNLPKGTLLPPVETGLALCYDARSGAGGGMWRDQSIYQRHITTAISWPTFRNGVATFSGSNLLYYKEAKFLNTQSFTLEFISKTNAASTKNTIISFQENENVNSRQIQVNLPWETNFVANIPTANRWGFPIAELNISSSRHKYNLIRNPAKFNSPQEFIALWQNSIKREGYWWSGSPSALATLQPISLFSIGGQWSSLSNFSEPFIGEVCAIRLYNRVLTDEEMKRNYEYDKKVFHL